MATEKKKRTGRGVLSTISFPYRDLDAAVSVAQSMLRGGGIPLSTDQLAGVLDLKPGSGNFAVKVAAARSFGLLVNSDGKFKLTNLGFSIVDKDDKRQRAARAEAFLTVPLFRKVYESFRGNQLPPKLGLVQALIEFGVSPKQGETARLMLEKSAKQAGFHGAGNDRLVEPIVGTPGTAPERQLEMEEPVPDVPKVVEAVGRASASKYGGLHPFIQGLLDTLPAPETNWTIEGRAKWLQAAAHCFDLIYMGSGEIHIAARPAPAGPPLKHYTYQITAGDGAATVLLHSATIYAATVSEATKEAKLEHARAGHVGDADAYRLLGDDGEIIWSRPLKEG